MTRMMKGIFVVVVLGVLFQIGHFFEHAFQWGVWLFGDRSKPWMSVVADWLAMTAGQIVYPMPDICTDEKGWMAKQMLYGMEVLHLVGNTIFLVTIGLLLAYFASNHTPYYKRMGENPTRKQTRHYLKWALAIEGFHLYEHIMLTVTVFTLGKPVGFSTLFGGTAFFPKEYAVGYRVSWHFFMNFIPTIFVMKALMPHVKEWMAWRPDLGTCECRIRH